MVCCTEKFSKERTLMVINTDKKNTNFLIFYLLCANIVRFFRRSILFLVFFDDQFCFSVINYIFEFSAIP